jgi:hypothetical protein
VPPFIPRPCRQFACEFPRIVDVKQLAQVLSIQKIGCQPGSTLGSCRKGPKTPARRNGDCKRLGLPAPSLDIPLYSPRSSWKVDRVWRGRGMCCRKRKCSRCSMLLLRAK